MRVARSILLALLLLCAVAGCSHDTVEMPDDPPPVPKQGPVPLSSPQGDAPATRPDGAPP